MAVPEQTPFKAHTGNGVTTVFAFDFLVLDEDDMLALVDGVEVSAAVYSVAGVGVSSGGTVTFDTAPASGASVALLRDSAATRATDYQSNGDLLAAVINRDFDRLWLVLQEIISGSKSSTRTLRAPVGEVVSELPASTLRANKLLGFTSAGAPEVSAFTQAQVAAAIAALSPAGTSGTIVLRELHTATAGQTIFNLSNTYTPGVNSLWVVLDGDPLPSLVDYAETSGTVVTFSSGLLAGQEVEFIIGQLVTSGVESEQVSFQASGGVARTQNSKNRDWISVKDYGVTGDSATDDTAAILAAISANPGKSIYFPRGTYKVTAAIVVSADNTYLFGNGDATIKQYTVDTDCVTFAPTTAGSSAAFLNGVGIEGINTVTETVSTSGAGVRFVQCNGYRLSNLTIYNAAESVTVQGGQYGTLTGWKAFAATGSYLGPRSALVHLRQAPIGGGAYQPCYTVSISDFKCSASKLREACILVSNGDGVLISDSYIANGLNALVMVQAERDNSYVSSLTIENSYLDCVNTTTGTEWGLYIPADGFAASYVYHVIVGDTCTIGNAKAIGVLCRKPETYDIRIAGQVINCPNWAIDVEGSTSTTDLVVTAKIATAGATGPGGGIRANSLKSLSVSSVFTGITNTCLLTSGTIGHGSISGCVNTSNVADWADSATWTYGVAVAGNASRYAGSQTWKSVQTVGGGYNTGHLVLGSYHLWVDSTGDLRITSGAPASDTDGTVVGAQS